MQSKIHYEDNLFYLTLMMKTMREGFSLNLDADFYLDRIIEDLSFIDATLGRIYSTLKENKNLIRRAEYLHGLVKSKTNFAELTEDILRKKYNFSDVLIPFFPKWEERLKATKADIAEIRLLLKEISQAEGDQEDLITSQELEILMQGQDDLPSKG